jgi:hypothetical protein
LVSNDAVITSNTRNTLFSSKMSCRPFQAYKPISYLNVENVRMENTK